MQNFRLALDSGYSWWLLAALCALGAGAVIYFYRRVDRSVDRRSLAIMIALRVLLILLVLVVLFRPSAGYQRGRAERPALLVLLDRSRSMSISDAPGLPSRFDAARGKLSGSGGALAELSRDFEVRLWVFDSSARKLADVNKLRDERPDGEATGLAAALAAAGGESGGVPLAGAILITDGVDNSGADPVAVIGKPGFPIHTVGAGTRLSESEDFRDVWVAAARADRYAAVDNVCEVRVYVEAAGFRGRAVPVSLYVKDGQGDDEKARAELVLDGRRGDQEVKLRFTPTIAGSFPARVEVKFDPAERVAENNVQEFLLNVTEPRIRLYYVEGRVRPEYGFLRRNWALDPSVEVTSLYRAKPGVFVEQSPSGSRSGRGGGAQIFPESFEAARRFNVFVLGDIERESFSLEELEILRRAVSEGAGLLCLPGQAAYGDGGWAGSPLAELLPVDVSAGGYSEEAFSMRLSAAGRAHPIFTDCADFFAKGEKGELPRMSFLNFVGAPKPGARVLAVHPEFKDDSGRDRPVLAVQDYGKGRTAAFTGGPTWKWELLRGRGRQTPYAKFWGQLVRWLAGEEVKRESAGAALAAHIDKSLYGPGEKVRLWAEAHGDGGRLAVNAKVEAAVEGPGGPDGEKARLVLGRVAESPGQFETIYEPPGPGSYSMIITAVDGGKALGEVEIQFRVGRPNLEFERLDLDERLLRRIADQTGGHYRDLAVMDELVGSLIARVREGREGREVRFYPDTAAKGWVVALLFLAAASAEWLLRKKLQLA